MSGIQNLRQQFTCIVDALKNQFSLRVLLLSSINSQWTKRVSNYDVLLMFTKYTPVKNVKNMWILTNWNIWSLMWSALKKQKNKKPTNSYYLGIGYIFKNKAIDRNMYTRLRSYYSYVQRVSNKIINKYELEH